jgi:hypothetical protein
VLGDMSENLEPAVQCLDGVLVGLVVKRLGSAARFLNHGSGALHAEKAQVVVSKK